MSQWRHELPCSKYVRIRTACVSCPRLQVQVQVQVRAHLPSSPRPPRACRSPPPAAATSGAAAPGERLRGAPPK